MFCLHSCRHVHCMHVCCPQRLGEGVRSSGTGVADGCESPRSSGRKSAFNSAPWKGLLGVLYNKELMFVVCPCVRDIWLDVLNLTFCPIGL